MFFRCLIAVLLLGAGAARAADKLPDDFAHLYERVSEFLDQTELSPLDLAVGSVNATRFYAAGRAGLPSNRSWFRAAATPGRASAAGLYLCVHGLADDLTGVRLDLETNRTKRIWLNAMVGTEERFQASIVNGKMWAPLSRVLPATDGCRAMAMLCLRSRDALVRRAGAYWGYWFADAPYWSAVRRQAAEDKDSVNRHIAGSLLQRAPRPAAPKPAKPSS